MAGITPDISTSSFKPLSLDEIMMVPLAKQKMEDELLSDTDKFGSLAADVLSPDAEQASGIIGDLKSRASSLADEVLERGVSRDQFNRLRKLKSDTQAQISSGFMANAIANKKAAAKFVNDLATNKAQQAGWSPREAQMWAQSQVQNFQGTAGVDGAFNTFQGRGLATKVDEADFIRKAIDDVAEHVSPTAMRMVRVGGLPAFQRAFQQGKVKSKDFNEIMSSISKQAASDVDLRNHLQQQAFFTGEENPLDHGKFEIVKRKDAKGNEYSERIWKVGKSRFGYRMAGMADAADYRNVDVSTSVYQDKVGFKMYTMGLEAKEADKMVAMTNGKLTDVKRRTLETLRSNLDIAQIEVDSLLTNKTKYENDLLNSRQDYVQLKNSASTDDDMKRLEALKTQILSGNKLWNSMDAEYANSAVKYSNAKAAVDSVYKIATKSMNPKQREGANIYKTIMDNIPNYEKDPIGALEKAIKNEPGGSEIIPANGVNQIGLGEEETEKFLISKYLELKGYPVKTDSRADRSLFNWTGSADMSYDSKIVDLMRTGRNALDTKVEHVLEASPRAESFKSIDAQNLGNKYSHEIRQANSLKKQVFSRDDITLAYGGGIFTDEDAATLIGESDKGFDYIPSMTDSWDDTGNKFDNVIVKNLQSGKMTTIQVVNNSDRSNELMAANRLMKSSNIEHQALGKRIIAGYQYMPLVKASRMYDQNTGEIPVPIQTKDGNRVNVKWEKISDYGTPYYTASINGIPLNNGQAIKGENGMVNVIYDFVNSKK